MKKSLLVLSVMLVTMLGLGGCVTPKPPPKPDAYDVLKLEEIAVGMYVTPPDPFRTQEAYNDIRAAGINFVNGFRWYDDTDAKILECLNYSQNAGLKYLVNDKVVLSNIEQYYKTKNPVLVDEAIARIENYNAHPAYGGQFFIDEPNRAQVTDLAEFTNLFDQTYPSTFWSINHFGHNVANLGCTYEQFVDDYFNLTNASMYSYDSYPFLVYDGDDPTAHAEMDGYFYGLDLVRTKTLERKVPFWTYIQTLGIGSADGTLTKRDPSENDIRWSVFANLAFGAKGLQYFTYFTPASGAETFTPGMVGTDGVKTAHYDQVKRVNAEFHDYGKLLLHCDAEGVIYHKQPSDRRYRLYSEKLESYGAVTEVAGDSFVAGCFQHVQTGKKYLMIVPPNPRASAAVELTIAGKHTVDAFIKGVKQSLTVTDGKLSLQIDAGDAVMLEI